MAKVTVTLEDKIRCSSRHPGAKTTVVTDLPASFGGHGEEATPTDVFMQSIGACMLTMMGMYATKLKVDLVGTTAEVTKTMSQGADLRILKVDVVINSRATPDDDAKKKLEDAASHCPIHKSLSSDIETTTSFNWGA